MIRDYNTKDAGAVKKIFEQYWTDKDFLNELAENLSNNETGFYVMDDGGSLEGVIGFREINGYLKNYSKTKKPVELYIVAAKTKNKGVGTKLVQKVLEDTKKEGFTEMLCYSPETHDSSWKFYEGLGFTKGGIIVDPEDDCPGMLWAKTF